MSWMLKEEVSEEDSVMVSKERREARGELGLRSAREGRPVEGPASLIEGVRSERAAFLRGGLEMGGLLRGETKSMTIGDAEGCRDGGAWEEIREGGWIEGSRSGKEGTKESRGGVDACDGGTGRKRGVGAGGGGIATEEAREERRLTTMGGSAGGVVGSSGWLEGGEGLVTCRFDDLKAFLIDFMRLGGLGGEAARGVCD